MHYLNRKHPFWRQSAFHLLLLLCSLTSQTTGFCITPFANPSFSAAPTVQQVDLRTVKVSWPGIVHRVDCVDQFIVKHWLKRNPQVYDLSELMDPSVFHYEVEKIAPNTAYSFQIVAREDKGLAGRDWNKSPVANFTTSESNPTVPPITEPIKFLSFAPHPFVGMGQVKKPRPSSSGEGQTPGGGQVGFVMVVAIVVGSLLGILVLVAIVYNMVRLVKTKEKEENREESEEEEFLQLNKRTVKIQIK